MNSRHWSAALLSLASLTLALSPSQAEEPPPPPQPDAAAVVERYLEARGGAERWREVKSLELAGTYAAFSEESPFVLIRRRGDLFRLEYTLLSKPTVRARDSQGPWMQHPFLTPEPDRVTEGPYKVQLERESLFGLELLDWRRKGLKIDLLGAGEIDGTVTLDLAVTLADGSAETWHLDPETYLEIAVDSEVNDHTQGPQRMTQRIFYDDFRSVEGLVLPFSLEFEFWARLETMRIDRIQVNVEIADERFSPPPSAKTEEPAEK